jgi:hypothetical protein
MLGFLLAAFRAGKSGPGWCASAGLIAMLIPALSWNIFSVSPNPEIGRTCAARLRRCRRCMPVDALALKESGAGTRVGAASHLGQLPGPTVCSSGKSRLGTGKGHITRHRRRIADLR